MRRFLSNYFDLLLLLVRGLGCACSRASEHCVQSRSNNCWFSVDADGA